eukprot:COSAG04_NODE_3315_length_2942_cov_1.361942_2_plen_432_part_00
MIILLFIAFNRPAAGQMPTTTLGCDSEDELLKRLRFVREVCEQAGEAFDDEYTLVPSSVTSWACAEQVLRVASDCGGLLAQSPWFASRKQALESAAAEAGAVPEGPRPTYHMTDPELTTIYSCDAVLDDGLAHAQGFALQGRQARATITIPPNRGKVRLEFEELVLGKDDSLRLYDGVGGDRELLRLSSSDSRPEPIVSSGDTMSVLFIGGAGGAGSRTSFSARISCVCEDSAAFVDADGEGCRVYAGAKHAQCDLLAPDSGRANANCPLACGHCGVGPCATAPCLNGGTCVESPGGAPPGAGRRDLFHDCAALGSFGRAYGGMLRRAIGGLHGGSAAHVQQGVRGGAAAFLPGLPGETGVIGRRARGHQAASEHGTSVRRVRGDRWLGCCWPRLSVHMCGGLDRSQLHQCSRRSYVLSSCDNHRDQLALH